MSSQGPTGDYGFVVESLLNYLKRKGQIWSAAQMASILLVNDYVKRRYGVELGLDRFVSKWVEYSEIEASKWQTVAQKNAEIVSSIGTQINYVQEQGTRTKFLPLGRRSRSQ